MVFKDSLKRKRDSLSKLFCSDEEEIQEMRVVVRFITIYFSVCETSPAENMSNDDSGEEDEERSPCNIIIEQKFKDIDLRRNIINFGCCFTVG